MPTADEVREWFKKWPEMNLARINGKLSDVFTIDIDGSEGRATFTELLAKLLPPTRTVITPHGGVHCEFRFDNRLQTGNRRLPFIDFKSEGGYVIIPPSIIGSKPYRVARDLRVATLSDPVVNELIRLIQEHERAKSSKDIGPEIDGAPKWVVAGMEGVAEGQRNEIAARL